MIHLEPTVDTELNRQRIQEAMKDQVQAVFHSNPRRIQRSWFSVLLSVGLLVCGSVVLVSLLGVDKIINGTLYGYGLQFSLAWADPYWLLFQSSVILLGVMLVLSGAVMYVGLTLKVKGLVKPLSDLKVVVYKDELYVFRKD